MSITNSITIMKRQVTMSDKKCIVLMVSKTFPHNHQRNGELTNFADMIIHLNKKHTIRSNYELWKKRADKINSSNAYLSLRQWECVPYKSKQKEFLAIGEIGIQKLDFAALTIGDCTIQNSVSMPVVDGIHVPPEMLANNDGLYLEDFFSWFQSYDLSKPMAIIHFTGFRY